MRHAAAATAAPSQAKIFAKIVLRNLEHHQNQTLLLWCSQHPSCIPSYVDEKWITPFMNIASFVFLHGTGNICSDYIFLQHVPEILTGRAYV